MSGWYLFTLYSYRFAEDKPSVGDEVTQVLPFQVEEEYNFNFSLYLEKRKQKYL